MRKSSFGEYYENFQNGRVFIAEGKQTVVAKAYKTYQGKTVSLCGRFIFSLRSEKPTFYRFYPKYGLRNLTYYAPSSNLKNLVFCVSSLSSKKDKARYKSLTKKFANLCLKHTGVHTLDELYIYTLKANLPLLRICPDSDNMASLTALSDLVRHSRIRKGLKCENLRKAVNEWFGRSPKGLIRRIGNLLVNNQSQPTRSLKLVLALCCRYWDINHLYSLLDAEYDQFFPFKALDIEKATSLFHSYSESRWLNLFEQFRLEPKNFYLKEILDDTIEMFDLLCHEGYCQLPSRPRTIEEIHDHLSRQYTQLSMRSLSEVVLPNTLSEMDEIKVGHFRLVTPKKGADLIDWAIHLDNCLASYINHAANKNSQIQIIGVFSGDCIIYAIEIYKKTICQFSGFKNKVPDLEDELKIRQAMGEHGIA